MNLIKNYSTYTASELETFEFDEWTQEDVDAFGVCETPHLSYIETEYMMTRMFGKGVMPLYATIMQKRGTAKVVVIWIYPDGDAIAEHYILGRRDLKRWTSDAEAYCDG